MRTFSMYFALLRCMRIDQDRVGETTSMYANRPRPCMRNDLDVCESTGMRNDRLPFRVYPTPKIRQGFKSLRQGSLLFFCKINISHLYAT